MGSIVLCPCLRLRKYFIRLYNFPETVYGAMRCVIGVILFYEEGIAGFYFFCRCCAGEMEDFVGGRVR